MSTQTVCPECVQGKHTNCSGEAFDFDADRTVPCMCEEPIKSAGLLPAPSDVPASDRAGEAQDGRTTAEWIRDLVKARQSAEAELAALRAGIEALAYGEGGSCGGRLRDSEGCFVQDLVLDLRALLTPPSTPSIPVSATGDVAGTVVEASEVCEDCGHVHTPAGCTGPSTPSDLWAGVAPNVCDCDDGAGA